MTPDLENPIPIPDPSKASIKSILLAFMEDRFFHYSTWIKPGDKYQAGDYL